LKFPQIDTITILLVIGAVLFSGCTNSAPSDTSVTTPQITAAMIKTLASPMVTLARQPVTTVEVKTTENTVKVFTGDYHWA
jgi:hypothetical protein